MDSYHIKTITSLLELETVRPLWAAFQCHPEADYEFYRYLVTTRSNIISPCVFALYRGDELLGLLVGRIENASVTFRFGYVTLLRIPIRQLVIIGSGMLGIRTADAIEVLLNAVDAFLNKQRIDRAYFERTKVDSPLEHQFRSLFTSRRLFLAKDAAEHWLLHLPNTWDDFLKKRSKKHRYWLKRLPGVLDNDFGKQWAIKRYLSAREASGFVQAAETVAKGTYHRGLGVGFRNDNETRGRISLDAKRGHLQGYVLFIKEEPKAFWYCSTYGRTLYLNATGYAPECRKYELGTILLMRILSDHCGTNVSIIDFGLGNAGYKQRFATDCFFESSPCLFSKTVRGCVLNTIEGLLSTIIRFSKGMLNRVHLTQYLKTHWRRRFEVRWHPEKQLSQ